METTSKGNGNPAEGEPIPNINTDNNPNEKPYKIIIGYLNSKAGTAYRATSKETQRHISARLKDGFTVDDFKTVIDKMYSKWKGTEFEEYLRPSTLFGTKFENYLNSKPAKTEQPKDDNKQYGGTWV
jgi:uncharacterized phage protein (TIGR02220 family)